MSKTLEHSRVVARETTTFDPLRAGATIIDENTAVKLSTGAIVLKEGSDAHVESKNAEQNRDYSDLFGDTKTKPKNAALTSLFGDMSIENLEIKPRPAPTKPATIQTPVDAVLATDPLQPAVVPTPATVSSETRTGNARKETPAHKNSLFDQDEDGTALDDRNLQNVFIPSEAIERRAAEDTEKHVIDKDLFDMPSDDVLVKLDPKRSSGSADPIMTKTAAVRDPRELQGDLDDDLFNLTDGAKASNSDTNTVNPSEFDFNSYIAQNLGSQTSKPARSLFD